MASSPGKSHRGVRIRITGPGRTEITVSDYLARRQSEPCAGLRNLLAIAPMVKEEKQITDARGEWDVYRWSNRALVPEQGGAGSRASLVTPPQPVTEQIELMGVYPEFRAIVALGGSSGSSCGSSA